MTTKRYELNPATINSIVEQVPEDRLDDLVEGLRDVIQNSYKQSSGEETFNLVDLVWVDDGDRHIDIEVIERENNDNN